MIGKQHDLYVNNLVGDVKANPETSIVTAIVRKKTSKVFHPRKGKMEMGSANAFCKLLSIYVFSCFPFGFEGRVWDLIVSVSDHCLSFYFAQSDPEKAEEFSDQSTDVFIENEHTQVPLLDKSIPLMDDNVVSKHGVTKILKGLDPSKALGPDELHPRVLKEQAKE